MAAEVQGEISGRSPASASAPRGSRVPGIWHQAEQPSPALQLARAELMLARHGAPLLHPIPSPRAPPALSHQSCFIPSITVPTLPLLSPWEGPGHRLLTTG